MRVEERRERRRRGGNVVKNVCLMYARSSVNSSGARRRQRFGDAIDEA